MGLDSGDVGFGDDCGEGTRFISHHEIERGLVGNGVRVVIVYEFCEGNVLSPRCRVRAAEDSKICFDFLVDSFCFAVSLGVVRGGEGKFIAKELSKFFGKG